MDLFWLKVLLSFLVGGGYIVLTLWLAERFGSKVGGLVAGLPSTVLISFLFIAWTQNTAAALSATIVAPVGLAAAPLFVIAFVHGYRKMKWWGLFWAFAFWLLLTTPFVLLHLTTFVATLGVAFIYYLFSFTLVWQFPHRSLKKNNISREEIIVRMIFAGSIIALAVVAAKLAGPFWGGLLSGFPAVFTSSIILLTRAHGIDFTAAVARTMPHGNLGTLIFILAFFWSVPPFGIIVGTVIAYAVSLLYALGIYHWRLKSEELIQE